MSPAGPPSWLVFAAAGAMFVRTLGAAVPFRIEVVEKGSGWPVPMVQLQTTSGVSFCTDNAGVVAFDLPEFMNQPTWLNVRSHGYEVDKDGFGNRGVRLVPQPGGAQRIEVRRTNLARRLGRLTGAGIYAESQKLGERLDWAESGVTGQDTVQVAAHRRKLFWAWGDTNIFSYPLGLFKTAGATTALSPLKSFAPPLELPFSYFRNDQGQLRNIIDLPNAGPIWVGGCASLPDRAGQEHLVCAYTKIKGPLEALESGLAEWDNASSNWKPLRVVWTNDGSGKPPFFPNGHVAFWTDGAGKPWAYFGEGLPNLRCPATFEGWQDSAQWERVENPKALAAADDGAKVEIASGSIAWNAWRKRWVTIFNQKFGGPSMLGEVWYAEADTPGGTWGRAVKVASHDNYSFYNPAVQTALTPEGAKFLLFEGTYTAQFADHAVPTPRYDYNQILYRLDLDEPALAGARGK